MTSYEQGFIEKCAQHGVNPQALIKEAGLLNALRKTWGRARPLWDTVTAKGLNDLDVKRLGKELYSDISLSTPNIFKKNAPRFRDEVAWQEAFRRSNGIKGTLEDWANKGI